MSHIYIYSPSSAVRDKAAFRRGVALAQKVGHEVEVDEAALATTCALPVTTPPVWPPSTARPPAAPMWR
jgi:muramoyltetrapeptide carboxypeptidase LdcA involved in peptidoglycan recycling